MPKKKTAPETELENLNINNEIANNQNPGSINDINENNDNDSENNINNDNNAALEENNINTSTVINTNSNIIEDEEYELEIEESEPTNNRNNVEVVNEMMNNAGIQSLEERSSNFIDGIFSNVTEQVHNEELKRDQDMVKSASQLRLATKQYLYVKDFASLSNRDIEYLNSKNINSTYDLITYEQNDPQLKTIKNNLFSNKQIGEKEIKNIAVIYYNTKLIHEQRGEVVDHDSLSYQDEERALKECDFYLHRMGFPVHYAQYIANPNDIEHYNEDITLVTQLSNYYKKEREFKSNEVPSELFKKFKEILMMEEQSALPVHLKGALIRQKNGEEYNQNDLLEAKTRMNGPEFIQSDRLNKAIDHIIHQEDILNKLDTKDDNYEKIRSNIEKEKDIINRKGISVQNLNNMIKYKQVDYLKNEIKSLEGKDPTSEMYNAIKKNIELQRNILGLKGIKKDELDSLLLEDGNKAFDKEFKEYSASMEAKAITKQDYWPNINAFYGRIATAFEADKYDVGADLSLKNLKEMASIMKEMAHYSKQLAFQGKINESANVNEHLSKIGQFLVVKGLQKEDILKINNSYCADIDNLCEGLFNKVTERNANTIENNVIDSSDPTRKQIEVNVDNNINNVKDYSQIEQFDDVPQVRSGLENNKLEVPSQDAQENVSQIDNGEELNIVS